MAMNFGQIALAVAGGAAKQFVKTQEELREEYKEKKERQQQWADRYGRRTLDELQSRADVVLNAGETLENAGMTSANLTQMVNKYDANSILELAKRVEKLNPRELAALKTNGQLNKVLTFEDTNAKSAEDWADVAVKSFTIPQIEPEPTPTELARTGGQRAGLLAGFRDRMGPRQEREYEEWYNSTYITGPDGEEYSIRELRAAPTGIMDRGKVPDFDLSVFDGGISSQETREWSIAEDKIVEMGLEAAKEDSVAYRLLTTNEESEKTLSSSAILLKLKTEPDLRKYYEEAVRNTYNQSEAYKSYFDNNRAAFNFFGNEEEMNSILNPISPEEQEQALLEQLNADLEDNNLKREDIAEVSTEEEIINHFETTEDSHVIVGGNRLMPRPDGVEFNPKAKKLEDPDTSFNPEDFKLLKQPEEIIIEPRPSSGRAEVKQRMAWDAENKKYYNPNGSYLVVSPRPDQTESTGFGRGAKRETSHEKWNRMWGGTHDPETGFPIVSEQESE